MSTPVVDHNTVAVMAMKYPREKVFEFVMLILSASPQIFHNLEHEKPCDDVKKTSHQIGDSCAPMGIRTPVWALRGPRPGPLDDGGVSHR